TCQSIWQELTTHKFDRYSLLINLGGGVIGDMGGFAASCYKRGIDFIQVPTTLLAMVDASIGGKLGIDFSNFKNQIGLFRYPKCVYIFPDFLKSLDKRQLLSGFAEVIKYALIQDVYFWQQIKASSLEKIDWEQVITKCVELKNKIVKEDPYEDGKRKILNFGHTIGHAIESHYLSQGKDLLHGEAIALGMLVESQLSPISEKEKIEISDCFKRYFSLIDIPPLESLLPFIQNDKKNKNQKVQFSLLTKIGKCEYNMKVTNSQLKNVFKSYI
ncbi:MAG: 3-dehydroquinate synthase family protein, partial [Bacteroidota bacterium]|nr:3-dehydroquinate synthase family protein [Bacteroidota bacterium]